MKPKAKKAQPPSIKMSLEEAHKYVRTITVETPTPPKEAGDPPGSHYRHLTIFGAAGAKAKRTMYYARIDFSGAGDGMSSPFMQPVMAENEAQAAAFLQFHAMVWTMALGQRHPIRKAKLQSAPREEGQEPVDLGSILNPATLEYESLAGMDAAAEDEVHLYFKAFVSIHPAVELVAE